MSELNCSVATQQEIKHLLIQISSTADEGEIGHLCERVQALLQPCGCPTKARLVLNGILREDGNAHLPRSVNLESLIPRQPLSLPHPISP